jgi:hypothetical protein
MTTYTVTPAFLPKDIHPRRYRYWPSQRQVPSLERSSHFPSLERPPLC